LGINNIFKVLSAVKVLPREKQTGFDAPTLQCKIISEKCVQLNNTIVKVLNKTAKIEVVL